ncbi:MAG TPA: thioester domain-containing protein, partial [Pseudonocardiaceae bacterium]|nr:thioester domain-containing protein [Pseudonocardiaceae bacterium]
ATVVGDGGDGTSVTMDKSQAEGGGQVTTQGELNEIQIVRNGVPDSKTVDAYCIDITTGLNKHTTMNGGTWADFIGRHGSTFHQNNEKINWILQNSFPSVQAPELSTAAKLPDTISSADAISGTQAAIWYFSDGATLETQGQSADLVALYKYLISPANTGIAEGTVGISPDKATGTVGQLVGPFTVTTNLTDLGLDIDALPSGVTVVDAKGTTLTASDMVNGAKFYLDVPAGTTATSGTLSLFGKVPSGEIFTAPHSQQLIAAGQTTVQTPVTASWTQGAATTTPTTPAAAGGTTPKTGQQQPGLAYTGVSATGPIVLGILLIAAGGLFLLVQRRLKRAA